MLVSYKAIQTNFVSFTKSFSKRMRQQGRDTVFIKGSTYSYFNFLFVS